jgi:hypothetical protein
VQYRPSRPAGALTTRHRQHCRLRGAGRGLHFANGQQHHARSWRHCASALQGCEVPCRVCQCSHMTHHGHQAPPHTRASTHVPKTRAARIAPFRPQESYRRAHLQLLAAWPQAATPPLSISRYTRDFTSLATLCSNADAVPRSGPTAEGRRGPESADSRGNSAKTRDCVCASTRPTLQGSLRQCATRIGGG